MSTEFKIISTTNKEQFALDLEVDFQDNYKIARGVQYTTVFNQKEQIIVHTYHVLLVRHND